MLNPSAWSKQFWSRSIFFECVQMFLSLIKYGILLHKLACLNLSKKIWMHSKNIEQYQNILNEQKDWAIVWEFFWGAACHSSSKIDESRIFDYDFLWCCHRSLCEVAEAKLMASATSPGYQMNAKHHTFHMTCWLLM